MSWFMSLVFKAINSHSVLNLLSAFWSPNWVLIVSIVLWDFRIWGLATSWLEFGWDFISAKSSSTLLEFGSLIPIFKLDASCYGAAVLVGPWYKPFGFNMGYWRIYYPRTVLSCSPMSIAIFYFICLIVCAKNPSYFNVWLFYWYSLMMLASFTGLGLNIWFFIDESSLEQIDIF